MVELHTRVIHIELEGDTLTIYEVSDYNDSTAPISYKAESLDKATTERCSKSHMSERTLDSWLLSQSWPTYHSLKQIA